MVNIETRMGEALKQVNLSNTIVDASLGKTIGILDRVTVFNANEDFKKNQPFAVVVENDATTTRAPIGTAPTLKDNNIRKVTFNRKRISTAIEITKQMLNNAGFDLEAYFKKLAVKRIVQGIEQQMFVTGSAVGSEDDKIQNVFATPSFWKYQVATTSAGTGKVTVLKDEMQKVFNEYCANNGKISNDMFWTFNMGILTDVLDKNGNSVQKDDNLPDGAYARLLGKSVYHTNYMATQVDTDTTVKPLGILMSKDSYGVAISDLELTSVNKTRNGTVVFVVEAWVDGKVLNQTDGLKILVPSTAF